MSDSQMFPSRGALREARLAADAKRSLAAGIWRYGSRTRVVGWVLVALFGVWTALCVPLNDDPEGCVVVPLFMAACYAVLLRPRILLDDDGMSVRNCFRSHRVQWSEIDQVVPLIPPNQNPLQIMKTDGTVVRCDACLKDIFVLTSRADLLADEIARRAAVAQGREPEQASNPLTAAERSQLLKRGFLRVVLARIVAGS